jgi:hypothetical protein
MNSARVAEKFSFCPGNFCWFFGKKFPGCYGYHENDGQVTGIADRHALTSPAGFPGWWVSIKNWGCKPPTGAV